MRLRSLSVALPAVLAAGLVALARPHAAQTRAWLAFRDDTLGIAFRHPGTPGLRVRAQGAHCEPGEAGWDGAVVDSSVIVMRALTTFDQLAASLAFRRDGGDWSAAGRDGAVARAATVRINGWKAVVTRDAGGLIYDPVLRQPVAARQWRLVAVGPPTSDCPVVMLGLATALTGAWDSATVAAVLESAVPAR